MILDLVGFISTHFQPKPSYGDPFQANFSTHVTFLNQGVTLRQAAFGEHLTENCPFFKPGSAAAGSCSCWRLLLAAG